MIKKKVVIIGAGFGGIEAAKYLKDLDGEVLIIDKTNHHLFQPLLYQVATATLSSVNIAAPIREILKKNKNTSTLLGEVVSISPEKKEVTLNDGAQISYEYLIIGIGTNTSYFNNPEWAKYSLGLKNLKNALDIRKRWLLSLEIAEQLKTKEERAPYLSFVIVGGGPTGVEMAGAITEIINGKFFNTYPHLDKKEAKIYLIEGDDKLLSTYKESLCTYTKKTLEKMGVTVLLSTKVTNVEEGSLTLQDKEKTFSLLSKNIIWAAGNKTSPLLKDLNTPLDKSGRALVETDLSIPHHPEIFVIGDAASFEEKGKPLPGIAPVAIQEGRFVAKEILRKEKNRGSEFKKGTFKYFDKGSLATIGKGKAAGEFKNIAFKGIFAWVIWSFVHIFYLISFHNKLSVMLDWIWLYFKGTRTAPLIQEEVKNPFTFKIP